MSNTYDQRITDFFDFQVKSNGNRIAIVDGETSATYEELSNLADRFVTLLRNDHQISSGDFAALAVEGKEIRLIAAIIGILKSGAAYLPVNPEYPPSLRKAIFQTVKPKCVITSKNVPDAEQINAKATTKLISLEDTLPLSDPTLLSKVHTTAANWTYLIYTSGTTGVPKGIAISHKNLLAVYNSWETIFKLDKSDRHLQMANPAFDVFTGDWARALCSGATLVLCPKETLINPQTLYELILKNDITVAEFVPATLNLLVEYMIENGLQFNSLRLLICGSDTWTVKDYKKTQAVCPSHTKIINTYGLSEATIDSLYCELTPEKITELNDNDSVPIGIPFPHAMAYVFDQNGKQISDGSQGELYIGGAGVSESGYFNDPALTAKRFIKNPQNPAETLYRTGDMVMRTPVGMNFVSRNEFQVKVNGKRVELTSIESVLTTHPQIKAATVIQSKESNQGNTTTLKAFLCLKDKNLTHKELPNFLKKRLPDYAIPQRFYEMHEQPLTFNGKISREINVLKKVTVREIKPVFVAPEGKLEKEIAKIVGDILKIERVSAVATFDELGCDSLQRSKILNRINKKYHLDLKLCEGFLSIEDISQVVLNSKNDQILPLNNNEIMP